MAHNDDTRKKILEILETTPFINHAAKKVGIGRATVHRWMSEDAQFKSAVEHALSSGRENLGEVAESVLVKKIREESLGAVKFYLQHNSHRYSARQGFPRFVGRSVPPPVPEKPKSLEDLFRNADGKLEVGRNAYEILIDEYGVDPSEITLRPKRPT